MIAVRAAGRGYGWWNVGNPSDAWMNSLFNEVGGAHVVSAYHFFLAGALSRNTISGGKGVLIQR